MISKFWWLNFILSLLILGLVATSVMIWQKQLIITAPKVPPAGNRWPDPLPEKTKKEDRKSYDTIVTENVFHKRRMEYTPIPPPAVKPVKAIKKPIEKIDIVPKELELLGKNDLNVFGVIIAGNLKYALINNMAQDSEKTQIRVRENEIAGRYTIKKIFPDSIIVKLDNKDYLVPVFEKKETAGPDGKKKLTENRKTIVEKVPAVVVADRDQENKEPETKPKNKDDGYEWVTFDTPFGKKRIRRKK